MRSPRKIIAPIAVILFVFCSSMILPALAELPETTETDAFAPIHVSEDVQNSIGIKTEPVQQLPPAHKKTVNGQIEAIPANTASVNAPLSGRVLSLLAQKGQQVEKNQALVLIDTPEIRQLAVESQRLVSQNKAAELQAQAKLELARRNYEREKTLLGLKISSAKDYQTAEADFKQAEAELQAARAQTRLSSALLTNRLAQLGQSIKATAQGQITLYAPIACIVLEQLVTPGEALEPGKPLFKLINISKVWATAQVYEKDLQNVRVGQRINIQTAAYPEKVFAGTVINIDPVVDPVSRTLAVRAVIENPSLLLKPQMFVTIDLLEKPVLQTSYYVPSESVVTVQGQQAVFIKKGEFFQPVHVQVGDTKDNLVQIITGLHPNDQIVTRRAYQLMAQGAKAAIPSEEEEGETKSAKGQARPESIILLLVGALVVLVVGFLAGRVSRKISPVSSSDVVVKQPNRSGTSEAEKQ